MLRVSIVEHPTMVVRQTVPTAIATMMPITGTGCVVLFRLAVPADLELSQHGRAFDSLHVILTKIAHSGLNTSPHPNVPLFFPYLAYLKASECESTKQPALSPKILDA